MVILIVPFLLVCSQAFLIILSNDSEVQLGSSFAVMLGLPSIIRLIFLSSSGI